MGRNKIKIERITNERTRLATFNKRKNGLVKKAMELAILCGVDVALIVIGNNKLTQYSSGDMDQLLLRYTDGGFDEPQAEPLTNEDYSKLYAKKNKNSGAKQGGSPAKKARLDSPTLPVPVKPLAAATPSSEARASPASRNPPTPPGKPVSPPGASSSHRLATAAPSRLPQCHQSNHQHGSSALNQSSYVGYPSTCSGSFPSPFSVPGGHFAPPDRSVSPHGYGSLSPSFDKPRSPRPSRSPTPPGSGGHRQEEHRTSGGRLLHEQQFSQKLNKKNLSLAIPEGLSSTSNLPGSTSAHSRHAPYTPGFTSLNLPSGMPFLGDSEVHTASILPSPSMFFAETPGSHEHGGSHYGPSHWGHWLPSPRHDHPQERFLSRDLRHVLQEGGLHHLPLGKVSSVGDKRKLLKE